MNAPSAPDAPATDSTPVPATSLAGSHRAVAWVYEGVWGVLTRWFRVPAHAPTLPTAPGQAALAMRPANGYLDYLRLGFFLLAGLKALGVLAGCAALNFALPGYGLLITVPVLITAAVVIACWWVGLHLKFDTQWYVLTDRSMRIRRGIWIIHEATITFENVQDITVLQGPVQRFFGIADVLVQTAGGGTPGKGQGGQVSPHAGFLQGLADAHRIKDLIAAKVRASRSAGLGDEHVREHRPAPAGAGLSEAHVRVLREILAEIRATRAGERVSG